MLLLLSFIAGFLFMNLHHEAVHRGKLAYITSLFTCGFSIIKSHKLHHKYFLEGADEFSWARRNESFYRFILRASIHRRIIGGFIPDLICFICMTYLFGISYAVLVISFTFHWELFEYWSHYRLKEETDDRYCWSWNVRDKFFNSISFNLGEHSKHHVKNDSHYPIVYIGKVVDSYLPLMPSKFFNFMDKCVTINKEKGVF